MLLQSKAFLQTAASLAPHMYEPHFNLATLSEKVTPLFSDTAFTSFATCKNKMCIPSKGTSSLVFYTASVI
jgi:hypothetical protein